ncbi:hypothetical protein [Actinomadura sp. NAK00032]|nr:hypothetical protein [Actinomadura sp. NAK00032]
MTDMVCTLCITRVLAVSTVGWGMTVVFAYGRNCSMIMLTGNIK